MPLARLARDADALPASAIDGLGRLAGRLADFGGADEPPARLHGDLWAGNRLVGADGRHWLVDPAAHGGHREFDLAMMRLFGGFGAACFDGYEDVSPLSPGWPERVPLHQVAPLVVHAIKFGGGYVGAAERRHPSLRLTHVSRERTAEPRSARLRRDLRDDPADQVLRAAGLHPQPARVP